MTLFTIGYEGLGIDEFTGFLVRNKVKRIADVRKNPISRKKGFSKRKLAEALAGNGIEYTHVPELGVPTEWRKRAKNEEITRAKMFRDYVKKILPKEPEAFEALEILIKRKGLALLCYEADASDCHRRFVAEELVKRSRGRLKVKDLQVLRPQGKY